MSDPSPAKIILRNVSKSFGDNHVLRGVDLEIRDGESLALIGTSGCGKSLLLKCILGLQTPDAGSILIDGVETTQYDGDDRMRYIGRFGVLFQYSGLFDSLTVWENIAFKWIQQGVLSHREAREKAADTLNTVGLAPEIVDLYPHELSGGMQKRVGIARAIFTEPEILFLDEPTAGLDPIMTNVIGRLISSCVNKLGATAVSITSDMTGAKQISDRIAMLHDGRIIWVGRNSDAESSGNPYVDQLIHHRAQGPIQMRVTRE
ncbi:MAG: ATP-binding cassette domain-containing protein [Alphaproteobacteria bacterium]|nr:ATP-binding cassette domain-containing protein [Alphaproteobacteria bacterium]